MKEFIDKLISRLEEVKEKHQPTINGKTTMRDLEVYKMTIGYAKEIVNELAEEYINTSTISKMENVGWIPCSERLPKDDSMYLVTVEYSSGKIEVNFGWFDRFGYIWYVGKNGFGTDNVHAWQSLPAPFKEGE